MLTVAVRNPDALGANTMVKVVVPFVAPTGDDGCAVTVKSAAFAPLMATLGVPVRFRSAAPVFSIVKVRVTLPPIAAGPKSVWSVAVGVVSPSVMVVLFHFTFISGEGEKLSHTVVASLL